MTARLIIASFNGKPSFSIEFIGPSREPTLTRQLEAIPLTEAESGLSIDQLRVRWARKELLSQIERAA